MSGYHPDRKVHNGTATLDDRIDFERIRAALASKPKSAGDGTSDSRAAAVAAVLRDGSAGTQVLLIRRAARDGDPWSGHMGLPGGHRETADASLLATAARETAEEIGLALMRDAKLLGRLPDLVAQATPSTPTRVTPFVFGLIREVTVRSGPEVQEVLWVELGPLARGERDTTLRMVHQGRCVERPAWNVGGRMVWGLTYQMLRSLFEALSRADRAARGGGRGMTKPG
jgi:8-oxo-dGTP pyrophosphatase MutT (NUDIX family)